MDDLLGDDESLSRVVENLLAREIETRKTASASLLDTLKHELEEK